MNHPLQPVPDDWTRALAVVAHPDDMEYGAAGAVARWTGEGRSVSYLIVTDGEAGIDGLAPADAALLRRKEQLVSAEIVGVQDVAFLHRPDGSVQYGLDLRRDIARHIRRVRPEILITATPELSVGTGDGVRFVNQADHRAVGVAVLDAARDAANRWIFPELAADGHGPWGAAAAYLMGSGRPTHAVDVTATLAAGVESLRAHGAYLRGLGRDFDPDHFLRSMTTRAGHSLGVAHAVAFEQVRIQGV